MINKPEKAGSYAAPCLFLYLSFITPYTTRSNAYPTVTVCPLLMRFCRRKFQLRLQTYCVLTNAKYHRQFVTKERKNGNCSISKRKSLQPKSQALSYQSLVEHFIDLGLDFAVGSVQHVFGRAGVRQHGLIQLTPFCQAVICLTFTNSANHNGFPIDKCIEQ